MAEFVSFREYVIKLAYSILDDDHGISLRSFRLLAQVLRRLDADILLREVDATDGRFYTKSDK